MCMKRAAILGIIWTTIAALPASAQSTNSGRSGHGFATVGIVSALGDPADRADEINPSAQTGDRGHWLLSGAVFVAPRVGVGLETFPHHATTAQLSNSSSVTFVEQLHEETVLMVTGRARALALPAVAIDAVFGVGALRQTRTSTFQYSSPSFQTTTTTGDTSPAFSLGADAPIAIGRYFAVIPQIRWYHLRRLGQLSRDTPVDAFPVDGPGSLFAFGVTAGVSW